MLSRQRNQPSKITVHHNPKPQTRLNLPIRPPRLRRLRPPNRRQPSRLILKRLPIILHRLNTDVPPLLDPRVRVLCATSRTTHSRSDHVRLPVARPLWIPAFAGMTGLCGNDGRRGFPALLSALGFACSWPPTTATSGLGVWRRWLHRFG